MSADLLALKVELRARICAIQSNIQQQELEFETRYRELTETQQRRRDEILLERHNRNDEIATIAREEDEKATWKGFLKRMFPRSPVNLYRRSDDRPSTQE